MKKNSMLKILTFSALGCCVFGVANVAVPQTVSAEEKIFIMSDKVELYQGTDFQGLRFSARMTVEQYAEYEAQGETTYGMLIAPKAYVNSKSSLYVGELTRENLFDESTKKYDWAIMGEDGKWEEYNGTKTRITNVTYDDIAYSSADETYVYYGTLSDVKPENLTVEFVGLAYAKVETESGTEYYFADYHENNVENSTASITYLAQENYLETGDNNVYTTYIQPTLTETTRYTVNHYKVGVDGATLEETEKVYTTVHAEIATEDIKKDYGYYTLTEDSVSTVYAYANNKTTLDLYYAVDFTLAGSTSLTNGTTVTTTGTWTATDNGVVSAAATSGAKRVALLGGVVVSEYTEFTVSTTIDSVSTSGNNPCISLYLADGTNTIDIGIVMDKASSNQLRFRMRDETNAATYYSNWNYYVNMGKDITASGVSMNVIFKRELNTESIMTNYIYIDGTEVASWNASIYDMGQKCAIGFMVDNAGATFTNVKIDMQDVELPLYTLGGSTTLSDGTTVSNNGTQWTYGKNSITSNGYTSTSTRYTSILGGLVIEENTEFSLTFTLTGTRMSGATNPCLSMVLSDGTNSLDFGICFDGNSGNDYAKVRFRMRHMVSLSTANAYWDENWNTYETISGLTGTDALADTLNVEYKRTLNESNEIVYYISINGVEMADWKASECTQTIGNELAIGVLVDGANATFSNITYTDLNA